MTITVSSKTRLSPFTLALSGAALLALVGCVDRNAPPEKDADPNEETASPDAEESETVSILRPDIEQPSQSAESLGPLEVTVGFPEGGTEFDDAAMESLQAILDSDQLEAGGAIILGAHSDSAGSDRANADAAEARGLVVAEWLIEQGVEEDRIQVIVFGEQNPVEPNALPDGSPNEEGRAANRRVEVEVLPPFRDNPIPAPSAPGSEFGD